MRMHKSIIFCLMISLFVACQDSPDDIPFRFDIQSVTLNTSSDQGTSSHNIKDVWVFNEGVDVGVFELPSEIPLIPVDERESSDIQISPGVRNNGINSATIIYPFYTSFFYDRPLTKGDFYILLKLFD